MALIKQLSREDVMFIAGETDSTYQHVAGLITFDNTDCPEFNFERFRQHCLERVALIPHLRWKLHSVPMGLDRPYWVEDENLNFDRHIKRIALPAPGDTATLHEVAANLYSNHLDHSKPLWEIWFIEGLEGGKFAYLQKFHHCMMDGEGAFKMIEVICDFEAHPSTAKQVAKSISEARAGQAPTSQQRSSRAWQHLSQLPREAAKGAYEMLRPKILEQFVWPRKPKQERPEVPTVSFNGAISSERAMATTSLPMPDLMKIKKHFKVSLNDVLLAIISTAIRSYLQDHVELPKESLRTNIPVSLRTEGDDQLSNKVTNTTVTLATNIADPTKRLEAINKESEQAKALAHSGGKGVIELFQMMPPILVSTLMESLPAEQLPQVLGANLIISNVRGSPIPLYIAGAKMDKLYPMSILTAGIGINFTCISYVDWMDFGIIVDPVLVPDHESIAEKLQDALIVYLELCSHQSKTVKKAPARKAAKQATTKKVAPKKITRKKTSSSKAKSKSK